MIKKILLAFMLFISIFFFSCNELGREINSQFIDFNIEKDYSKIERHQYIDNNKLEYNSIEDQSFLITIEKDNFYAVYSILLNQFVIDFKENISITYLNNYYFPPYIQVTYDDGAKELFDFMGNKILEKNFYQNLNINVTRERNHEDWLYKETFSYYIDSLFNSITYISINNIVKREIFNENDNLTSGDKITFVPKGVDLEEIGLNGYYMVEQNDYVQIFNEKNQLVSTIDRNIDLQFSVSFAGFLFYQQVLLLDNDEKEFDYAIEMDNQLIKYDLITTRIDLRNGVIEEIDANFLIIDGEACKDKKGIYSYGNVEIRLIENKRLAIAKKFIIDENCEIIYNFSNAISLESLIRLDYKHYFDYESQRLYDNKMNIIFDFLNNDKNIEFVSFDYGNQLIKCFRNGKYGYVNYDMELFIPFEYDIIGDYFINEFTYGVINGENYIININKTSEKTDYSFVNDAPLLVNVILKDNKYLYQLYTYSNELVLEFISLNQVDIQVNNVIFNNNKYYYIIGNEYNVNLNSEQGFIFRLVVKGNYD